ncbi:hypothetical protein [Leclercia adecarboxylata]|uniref:hypothetical protein n=1 Tax=Leclercia adecarboxylata TaxID=83655 RepID=UPI001CBDB99B|nr:hypothetical protein [Leclercia adecarboxylata]
MRSHDRLRIVLTQARQFWRAFAYVMHLHENRYIKRAGVAGIRARAGSTICNVIDVILCNNFSK